MLAELTTSIRQQTGGRYEVLGEIGREADGAQLCLARETADRKLVALRLERVGTRPDGSGEYSVDVAPELPETFAARRPCIHCGSQISAARRTCDVCGGDTAGIERDLLEGSSRSEIFRTIREAAGAEYEVLGDMKSAGDGGRLCMAREIATGRVVALSLHRDPSETGRDAYSLVVTSLFDDASAPKTESAPPASDTAATGAGSVRPAEGPRLCPVCGSEFEPHTLFCPRDGSVLTPTVRTDSIVGEVIADRYLVLERVGEGGFGQVYLAEHARMGRRCAIKVMNASFRHDADAIARFAREAANSSRINHPNVATIYDFGETRDGLIYLVMEYVEGRTTLADVLAREQKLSPTRTIEILLQVADALEAAHALGIVHRDLKPHNIMLSSGRDGTEIVKVVDFGIAKALEGERQNITRTGFVIGTLEYMSPEQLMGEAVDERSDIYSLGCVLFEMLTGQSTVAGVSGQAAVVRRMTQDPPRICDIDSSVPALLGDIVARALARDPAARFQSVQGLRDALAGVRRATSGERMISLRRAGDEPRTPPASSSAIAPRPVPAVPLAAAEVRGAEADRVATPPGPPPGEMAVPPSRPATVAPDRRRTTLIFGLAAGIAVVLGGAYLATRGGTENPRSALAPTEPPVVTADSAGPAPVSAFAPLAGAAPDSLSSSPAAAAAAQAQLRIAGTLPPGARVLLDGNVVEAREVSVSPGTHRISVAAPGYRTNDTVLVIRAGERVSWTPPLRREEASAGAAPTPAAAISPAGEAAVVEPQPRVLGVTATPLPPAVEPEATPGDRSPPTTVPDPEAAATAGTHAAVERYLAALGSRDLARLRSAYPGITPSEVSTWRDFFGAIRELQVRALDMQPPELDGNRAVVAFTARLDFTDRSGAKNTTQRYRATLSLNGDAWRLDAVRPE